MESNSISSGSDLVFSSEVLDTATSEVMADLAAWGLLIRAMVVDSSTDDPIASHRSLYRDTVGRMTLAKVERDEDSYICEIEARRGGALVGLADPNLFVPFALAPEHDAALQDAVDQALGLARQYVPTTEGETTPPSFSFGVTARAVGVIAEGTAMIRREGAPVCHYIVPELIISPSRDTSISVDFTRFALDNSSVSVPHSGRAIVRDASTDFLLSVLSNLTGALSFVPTAGPIFGLFQGYFNIIALIEGTGTSELQQVLNVLPGLIGQAFADATIREQLGHIATFMDQFRSNQSTLKNSRDQPNYIRTTYLPLLENQLNHTGAGTVNNAIHQLKQLYDGTPWTDIRRIEKILGAVALGIGYRMVIHRTRVMLYAGLAADAKSKNNTSLHDQYHSSMLDALNQYGEAVESSDVSVRRLIDWMVAYRGQRFARTSVYWTCKESFLFFRLSIFDRLENNRELYWTNFWANSTPGVEWAKRESEAQYNGITATAQQEVMPIQARATDMVTAYNQLRQKILV